MKYRFLLVTVLAIASCFGQAADGFLPAAKSTELLERSLQLIEATTAASPDSGRAVSPVLEDARQALMVLGSFVRDHAPTLGRVMADAAAGEAVAVEFIRTNAPRHLALLLALMDEAEREGRLVPMAPLQRFTFVLGAVGMPLLAACGVQALGVAPRLLGKSLQMQVMGDVAIAERIDLALRALSTTKGRS